MTEAQAGEMIEILKHIRKILMEFKEKGVKVEDYRTRLAKEFKKG